MADPRPSSIDPWDLDRLRLPVELIGEAGPSRAPPRHRPGESFLRGPIPFDWIAAACRLPGSGLHLASTFRFLCGRYREENRWGLEAIAVGLQVSPDTARRGLHAAELAGLLSVEREPGCKLSVKILDPPDSGAGSHRPLYGPIPWAWWLAALRLDGPALRTASACWMVAGWNRSASFDLTLERWEELGLSRFAAARGLQRLGQSGLVEVVKHSGRSPIVTLLNGPGPMTSEP